MEHSQTMFFYDLFTVSLKITDELFGDERNRIDAEDETNPNELIDPHVPLAVQDAPKSFVFNLTLTGKRCDADAEFLPDLLHDPNHLRSVCGVLHHSSSCLFRILRSSKPASPVADAFIVTIR